MSESNNKPVQQNQTNAYQRPVANVYDFYLTGNITDAKEYQDWNQIMRSATENDSIVIHINSNGGEIFTAIQLMRSMADSNATICASVEGMCMSAATLIFLCADVVEVSEHSHFMFHTYSSGNWGKGSEQLQGVMADDKWAKHLFNQVYKGFLKPQEIKDLIEGKDLWMNPAEVNKRLAARNVSVKRANKKQKKEITNGNT